ncbi:M23 family metallopeptidase [Zongyangia hominis]|uniref:M23 family metallopeptidase n=1 Tax=Zongyangia hominis TaxID=2763677 RepID=A0A926IAT1_9FIRM|nr:M23 family metallopeptidase [Zongyangia hominis]MBC8569538.1 M23 family metallopeptidase [Zongyangia hominis]
MNEVRQENRPDVRQEYRQNASTSPYRRKPADPQHSQQEEPVIFSVVVIQVCICVFVIAAAFILRGFGGDTYEAVRSGYWSLVGASGSSSVSSVPSASGDKQSGASNYADKMRQLEEKLSQVPEGYAPSGAGKPANGGDSSDKGKEEDSSSQASGEESGQDSSDASAARQSGMGGQHDVSFVAYAAVGSKDNQRWAAPEGTALSPFFLTAVPIAPVDGTITSPYGYRIHPITGKLDFHTGLDIAAPHNTPIRAILPGTVKEIGESGVYGNYIVVAHQNGLESVYNHCESITAQVGTVVRQGDWIARVGSTGLSTGNHVHLDIKINGVYVNPYLAYTGVAYADISDL